ncbi:MAG: ABC transporter permease [Alphaproteobacteria bacterium]
MNGFYKIFLKLVLGLLISLIGVSIGLFAIFELLPSDPARIMLGVNARPDTYAALRLEMQLDHPAFYRYYLWIKGLAQGDFGTSFVHQQAIGQMLAARFAISGPLCLITIFFTLLLALPLGIYAAKNHQQLPDKALFMGFQLFIAIPNFWLGLMLIFVFSIYFDLFAAGGFAGWRDEAGIFNMISILQGLKSLLLPAISLALPQAALLAKTTRSALLGLLSSDFIRTAKAKGASEARIWWLHILPNAAVVIATFIGLQISFLIAGAVIIENLYFLPGIGSLLFQAVSERDLPLVKNILFMLVGAIILIHYGVHYLSKWLDPRLRA